MKYERGSFIVVPSREKLRGMPVPAQALYMWLCAYANETGECFPARSTLAKDCDCSLPTIDRMTQLLVDRGLLAVEKRSKNGESLTNLYSVIIWGGSHTDLPPSHTDLPRVATQIDTELYPVLTQSTEVVAEDSDERPRRKKKVTPEIQAVFDIFADNPARFQWRLYEAEREAAAILFKEYGIEKVQGRYKYLKNHKDDVGAPQIASPSQMLEKMPKLEYFAKNHA